MRNWARHFWQRRNWRLIFSITAYVGSYWFPQEHAQLVRDAAFASAMLSWKLWQQRMEHSRRMARGADHGIGLFGVRKEDD